MVTNLSGVEAGCKAILKEKGQPLPEVKPAGTAAPKTSGHRHQAQSVSRIKTSP